MWQVTGKGRNSSGSPESQAGPYPPRSPASSKSTPVPSQCSPAALKFCRRTGTLKWVLLIQFNLCLSNRLPPQSGVAALCCWELSWLCLVSRKEMEHGRTARGAEQSWDAALNHGDAIAGTTHGCKPGYPVLSHIQLFFFFLSQATKYF